MNDTLDAEVAIIGGGVIGSAAAYFLKAAGVERVTVIDLSRMGYRRVLDRAPYPELGIV